MCSVDVPGGLKDWVISKETLMKVYPLMSKNYEVGGKFTFPANSETGEIKRRTSHKKIHTMNGDKDSVQAPLGILNFHTHPISCYLQEDTIWGWPSGEDIRESLLFGLRGSFAHAIPAVEGVYILQTNHCILTSLCASLPSAAIDGPEFDELVDIYIEELQAMDRYSQDFSNYLKEKGMSKEELLDAVTRSPTRFDVICDILRGIIVALVEIYFRSSHGFRTYRINSRKQITPNDFIQFVESFQLGNIFNHKKKVRGCGNNLKCNGIPIYSKGSVKNTPFKKYLKEYENDTGFYAVDKHGHTLSLNVPVSDIYNILPLIEKISNKFIKCDKWFNLSLTPNNIFVQNQYVPYISLDTKFKKETLQYYSKNYESYLARGILPIMPQRDAIFHYFSISGDCSYKDIQKHVRRSQTSFAPVAKPPESTRSGLHLVRSSTANPAAQIHIIGSEKCSYTVRADKLLRSSKTPFTKEYYGTIGEALQRSQTKTVPAIYMYGKLIGGYDDLHSILKKSLLFEKQINNEPRRVRNTFRRR